MCSHFNYLQPTFDVSSLKNCGVVKHGKAAAKFREDFCLIKDEKSHKPRRAHQGVYAEGKIRDEKCNGHCCWQSSIAEKIRKINDNKSCDLEWCIMKWKSKNGNERMLFVCFELFTGSY